jgi:hypothetical protein
MSSSIILGITLEICPSFLASLIRIANMSTTIMKRIGESGSPCFTLFFGLEVWSYLVIYFDSNMTPFHEKGYPLAPSRREVFQL